MSTALSVLSLLMAAGCSREQTRLAPEPQPASPGHAVIDRNGATSDGGGATQDSRAQAAAGARKARAQLASLPGSKIKGAAALQEVPDGVQIALRVEHAKPGGGRVALHAAGHCPEGPKLAKRAAAATVPNETGLGTLLIDEGGAGTLDVTLKDANLKTMQAGTLLGQSLLVYRLQPPEKPGERSEIAVACAQIQPER